MFQAQKPRRIRVLIVIVILALSGCSDDARVTQIALEASQRQAHQDQEMSRLNREVAQGTNRLIETRGAADQQILSQQQGLQQQRDKLDLERQSISSDRSRESLLAPILLTLGSLLVCSLPLILCWYLLHRLGAESAETQVTQLLIEQFVDQVRPDLLPQVQSIALPPPDVGDPGLNEPSEPARH